MRSAPDAPATPWEYRFDAVVVGHPLEPSVRCEHDTGGDPHVLTVRRQISDLDSSLVELVNKRLRLVAQLKRYKDEHDIGFVDLAREEWMLQYLQRANRGPAVGGRAS